MPAAFDEFTFRARPRAAMNLPGLCPMCGGEAARSVVFAAGVGRETYRCHVDGEISYAYGGEVRIADLGRAASSAQARVAAYALEGTDEVITAIA